MVGFARAALSLGLFAGFFAVALAELVGLIALTVWLSTQIIPLLAIRLLIPVVVVGVGAILRSFWRALRAPQPEPPLGLVVQAEREPRFWAAVRDLARQAGTRPPDEIVLVNEANAAVAEHTRLLGLRGGTRRLVLGMPLLYTFTVAELTAVIAHELGHYSRRHTRLGEVSYRARLTISGTIRRLSPANPLSWGLKAYAGLYLLVDNAVRRRQELEADQSAVRVAGKEATAAALRRTPELDGTWIWFLALHVAPGRLHGYYPDDLYGGFAAMTDAGVTMEREPDPETERSRWDTHPPLDVRLAAIEAAPGVPVAADDRPARELFTDFDGLARELTLLIADEDDHTFLPWPELTTATRIAGLQEEADRYFRSIARTAQRETADLTTVLELIAAGRLLEIAQPLFPTATRRELPGLFADPLETMLTLAAARSGTANWRHSWSSPPDFLTPDGTEPPLSQIAELALHPGGLPETRDRLADLGIDVGAATQERLHPQASGTEVIGGMANTRVNGTPHDLLLLTGGFVLIPNPGRVNKGRLRLMDLVEDTPADKLAANNRYLAFETVDKAEIVRRVPLRFRLTLADGQLLDIRERWTGEELPNSRTTLTEVLERL
ncbi:M48 family metallopeptidase [Acrocarpospora catenulata]|uniref:M48 family metallopeptidase n=1 Tax=Acrocarpospora catenulata TaxID=2836182 RepID=UPI001BDA6959|nr:M48 family metallopeptidase [Acrocarpospora catenulata]